MLKKDRRSCFPINIILIEDDKYVVNIIREIFEEEICFNIIGIFDNAKDTIAYVKKNKVDVAIIDINISGEHNGIYLTKKLKEITELKVIILSSDSMSQIYVDSFNSGADHYVNKFDMLMLPEIIRNVNSGKDPTSVLADMFRRISIENKIEKLTECEREILDCSIDKLNREQISIRTNKSESTIRNQINSILKKMSSKNLKDAAKKYLMIKSTKNN